MTVRGVGDLGQRPQALEAELEQRNDKTDRKARCAHGLMRKSGRLLCPAREAEQWILQPTPDQVPRDQMQQQASTILYLKRIRPRTHTALKSFPLPLVDLSIHLLA